MIVVVVGDGDIDNNSDSIGPSGVVVFVVIGLNGGAGGKRKGR